jgi:hypothetical protein
VNIDKKLISAFAISDCIQIISGKDFYVFDPCGQYLLSLNEKEDNKQPKAQHYKLNEVANRFPDQFKPFSFLDLDLTSTVVSGLVIRIPMRIKPSAISNLVLDSNTVKSFFENAKNISCGSLLFSKSLVYIGFKHILENENIANKDMEVYLESNDKTNKELRINMIAENGWERTGITKLFKTFKPPEIIYNQNVSIKKYNYELSDSVENIRKVNTVLERDNWIVTGINGYGRLRDLAITELYNYFNMKPYVIAAVRVPSDLDLINKDSRFDTGMLFNNSKISHTTGFPFHIEGEFIPNFHNCEKKGSTKMKALSSIEGENACQEWNNCIVLTAINLLYPKLLVEIKSKVDSLLSKTSYSLQDKISIAKGNFKIFD